ncbi:MAG: HdeA/HdeB family chaperone [Pseudomonadota bacterium]
MIWQLAILILLFNFWPASSYADAETTKGEQIIDISVTTCKEFLDAEIEDQHDILVFHHGYVLGQRQDTLIDVLALSEISNNVRKTCEENPREVVLEVFRGIESL